MKLLFKCLIAFCVFISCNGNTDKITNIKVSSSDSTTVQIIDTLYNFGKIKEGEKVAYSYRFKNTGKKPLKIESASSTCGCTVPKVPEKPIMPGEIGFLKVEFNSAHKSGFVQKPITVISNANPPFPMLMLEGNVDTESH